ncbi:BZ3500_MvSof-1268-A1-R1_Chr4-2g06925 [Microbotryum saponariae]|uniref:BZ3500_MvSof-1268-A1-R1_Chr4-2g06925 protein n=1 Tax=Microbotryum saponariae TaxID=289078 RepID=A0A2X0MXI4_9BASI|nr:BZ3500_MvSof-1268-A1-R1_Chr4-2g06925 [Microbotryum saponariae]SDA06590.1 BZ3501_MvSof-1269-A2-R1_Chr4-2g06636 [Microbotryum saponariae]
MCTVRQLVHILFATFGPVAPDCPAHQHSTMVDKFPLASAVQHSPSQSPDSPLGVRSFGYARAPALRPLRLATSRPGSTLRRRPASQHPRNDPARAASRIPSDLRSQLNIFDHSGT